MTPGYIHLLLNHLPVVGVLAGIPILLTGLLKKKSLLTETALWLFLASAIITVPVYFSGDNAEHEVEEYALVSEHELEEHEDWGKRSLWLGGALGFLALLGILQLRKNPEAAQKLLWAIFIFSLLTMVSHGITSMEGGKIRRPELRGEDPKTVTLPATAPAEGSEGEKE
jgi:uncharacterized membrane protein